VNTDPTTRQDIHDNAEATAPGVVGVDSARIADDIVVTWQCIAKALTPIIGPRGVAALLTRSLHLTAQAYPWLEGMKTDVDVAALKPLLAAQTGDVAAAATTLLLRTFRDLLSALIGYSLTVRLLRSALPAFLIDPPAQDPLP
jgi:hypothetical protein